MDDRKTLRWGSALALAIGCAAAPATAVEMTAGDWKFTANGKRERPLHRVEL
jgi:hypothetical protein